MTGWALPHMRPPVDPLTDGARESLIHWSRCMTADDDRRRAAIKALVDVAHSDELALYALAEITDPTGLQLLREERNRAWSNPHSEIIEAVE